MSFKLLLKRAMLPCFVFCHCLTFAQENKTSEFNYLFSAKGGLYFIPQIPIHGARFGFEVTDKSFNDFGLEFTYQYLEDGNELISKQGIEFSYHNAFQAKPFPLYWSAQFRYQRIGHNYQIGLQPINSMVIAQHSAYGLGLGLGKKFRLLDLLSYELTLGARSNLEYQKRESSSSSSASTNINLSPELFLQMRLSLSF